MSTRRAFLRNSALAMFGVGAAPAWLTRAAYAQTDGKRRKIMVAILQRGAADGLNIVVPFGEKSYYAMRPTIAIPKPTEAGESAIDLDGFFGLHPSLAPLKPIYDSGQFAIIQAAGSPDPTRSHFDAQDYMESGTPGRKSTRDGWLNRTLTRAAGESSPVRAVSLGPQLPRMLRGSNAAVAINTVAEFQVRDQMASESFQAMYSKSLDTELHGTGRDTFEAVKLLQSIARQANGGGSRYPNGRFGQSLQQIARLIKADVGLEVAFADIGGWDHHVNEVGLRPSQGPLANLLREFGGALAAFHADLGDRMEDVVLVTMSEFGRTARQNGTRGTDHGHANVMFAMGGAVAGGKIHGDWPGLEREQLYEGRDLALTTDFRDVLGEVISRHLDRRDLKTVFPGHTAGRMHGFIKT